MAIGSDASPVAVLTVTLLFTSIAIVATVLRLYTRFGISHNAGLDDGFIAVAAAFAIATESMIVLEAVYDLGRSNQSLTSAESAMYAKSVYISIVLYNAALFCTKMSLLLQYLRIFPQRSFHMICYTLMTVVILYSGWCIISQIFFCDPIAAFWDPSLQKEGSCLPKVTVWFVNAGINIMTDVAIVALPIPLIRNIKIGRRQKIALIGVFALGFFTCLTSVLRLQSLYTAAQLEGGLNQHGALAALWSCVEVATGIICSCLPTLRTLLARTVPHMLGSSHRTDASLPYAHHKASRGTILEISGRGVSGRGKPIHHSLARRNSSPVDSIALNEIAQSPNKIRVVTVLDQEIERHGGTRSEELSTRDLMIRSSFED